MANELNYRPAGENEPAAAPAGDSGWGKVIAGVFVVVLLLAIGAWFTAKRHATEAREEQKRQQVRQERSRIELKVIRRESLTPVEQEEWRLMNEEEAKTKLKGE